MLPENFFEREKPSSSTIGVLIIYGMVCIYLYLEVIGLNKKISYDFRSGLSSFSLVSGVGIYFFHKQFRNLYIFLGALAVGIMNFGFYLLIRHNQLFHFHKMNPPVAFRNIILYVLFLQVCRLISFKIQYQDLIVPSRSFSATSDNRRHTYEDIFLLFLYFAFCALIVSTI